MATDQPADLAPVVDVLIRVVEYLIGDPVPAPPDASRVRHLHTVK